MADFKKIFPFRKEMIVENRIGICEQRLNMLEDDMATLEERIISDIIDVLKTMR